MFNYHSENISEIINVNNVTQCKYDVSKTLTRIMEYFHKIETNIFFMIMFDNIESSFINIYS